MNPTPETRASLLIRVRDPADQAAWREFVEIYRLDKKSLPKGPVNLVDP